MNLASNMRQCIFWTARPLHTNWKEDAWGSKRGTAAKSRQLRACRSAWPTDTSCTQGSVRPADTSSSHRRRTTTSAGDGVAFGMLLLASSWAEQKPPAPSDRAEQDKMEHWFSGRSAGAAATGEAAAGATGRGGSARSEGRGANAGDDGDGTAGREAAGAGGGEDATAPEGFGGGGAPRDENGVDAAAEGAGGGAVERTGGGFDAVAEGCALAMPARLLAPPPPAPTVTAPPLYPSGALSVPARMAYSLALLLCAGCSPGNWNLHPRARQNRQ